MHSSEDVDLREQTENGDSKAMFHDNGIINFSSCHDIYYKHHCIKYDNVI